jgi:hypothetical protein
MQDCPRLTKRSDLSRLFTISHVLRPPLTTLACSDVSIFFYGTFAHRLPFRLLLCFSILVTPFTCGFPHILVWSQPRVYYNLP